MKQIILLLVLFIVNFNSFGQSTVWYEPQDNPHRGLYINHFFYVDPAVWNQGAPYTGYKPEMSILGADLDHDGIYEKENELLEYCKSNHITHILLLDLHYILGRGIQIWDYDEGRYVDAEVRLCKFMNIARNQYCIDQIDAAGDNRNFFDGIDNFQSNLFPSPTAPIVIPPNRLASYSLNDIRLLEDSTLHPGDVGYQQSEVLKFYYRVVNFQANHDCESYFNYLHMEYEFWQNGFWDDYTSFTYNCTYTTGSNIVTTTNTAGLIVGMTVSHIVNGIDDFPNGTIISAIISSNQFIISQQPIISHANTNITISYTLDPSCSNFCCVDNLYDRSPACASSCGPVTFPNRETAKYFSHFLPTIESLRTFIDDKNSGVNSNDDHFMRLEAYLQSVRYSGIPIDEFTAKMDGNDNPPTPGTVYFSQCTNSLGVTHSRLLDRLCPHQFIRYIPGQIPIVSDWTFYQDFDDHNQPLLPSTDGLTDFHPILSSESISDHGYDNYWGSWFHENKKNTIFEAERLNYLSWTCNGRVWGTGNYSLVENSVHPGNILWFAQTHMVHKLDNPKIFIADSPICSNNATENVTFHYTGPCESGTTISFRILSHSGGQIFPTGGGWFTQQTISPSQIDPPLCPSVTPYYFANDIIVNLNNHFNVYSNPYHVEMKLEYAGGCTSEVYSEEIDINSGPNIQAQGPIVFCEGDYTTLHASGGVSSSYQWKRDGTDISGETSVDLKVTSSGVYTCLIGGQAISNCNGESDTIVVLVNSNPSISVFSDCQISGPYRLYVGPQMLSIPTANGPGGATYLWSTGETTDQIVVQNIGWYYLTVTNPNGCSNTVYTYLRNDNTPPLLNGVQSADIINPSTGCSSDGSVTVSFDNSYYSSHYDSPVSAYYTDGTNTFSFDWPKDPSGNHPNISATITGLQAGDYELYVGVGGGLCVASLTFHLGSPSSNLGISTSNSSPSCFNNNDGEIEIIAIGSNPPYSIETPELGIQSEVIQSIPFNTGLTNLQAGTYFLRITDSNCNWEVIPVTISSPNPISVIITGQDVTGCHSNQNGSALITGVSGGTPPYSYLWNDLSNSTTNHISNVGHGAYTVIVTDANGCTGTATIEISAPEELHLVPDEPFDLNTTCGCNASLQYLFYGGTGNLTVIPSSWTINGDYAYMNNLCSQATPYTITITDDNACSISDSHIITDGSLQAFSSSTSIACYGQSTTVSVTAVGGVPPYSGIGNFTETAGIYSYTVTDANNCSSTTTITITEPTNPLSISVSAGTILCNGGTANVNISASGGTPPYTGTGNFQLTAGTYTSIVTDANGCSTSNTTIINQPLPLTVSATQTNQPLPCFGSNLGTAVAIPQGGTPPYTYLWSPLGGNSQTSTNLPAGLYTVTCDDANNCGTTSSTVNIIEDPICCDLHGNSDLHQSDFNVSHQLNHTDYDLNESVSIPAGVGIVITDCDISVGTGYTITIKQGGSLTLNGVTHLHGCSGMWGGIVVEPGGEFYIDGSPSAKPIIEDAEHGVYVEMVGLASTLHSGLKLRNGVFSSNYTDIFLEENNTGDINQVNIDVFGCLFNKTHDLYFSSNIAQLGASPFAGILLHNFNGIIGSFAENTNEFSDHDLGIQCFNSNVTINNCRFERILPEPVYGNYFDGTGIHILAMNNQYTVHETGLGNYSLIPTFSDCKNGIFIEGSGGYAHYNFMTNVNHGITLTQLLPKVQFLIFSNNLECKYEGIVCNFNKDAEQIEIIGNVISIDNPAQSTGNAIGIYDYLSSCPYLVVLDNHIILEHSKGGIDVYGAKGITVSQNIINLNNDAENRYGIGLWSADKNTISCNDVQGNSVNVSSSTQVGYKFSISQRNQIHCNNAYTTNTGFEFNNQCTETDFKGNLVASDQWMGLRVLHSGVMGTQIHNGNKWYPPFYSNGNIEAENTNNGNELLSEFDVNPNDGVVYNPSHPLSAGTWFITDFNSHAFDCGSNQICGIPDGELNASGNNNLDYMIATGSFHSNEFDSENVWMAKKYLYEKIIQNPLMLNDPIISGFFNQESFAATADFQEVKFKILETAGLLEANSVDFLGNYKNIDSLQKELEIADSVNLVLNGSNSAIIATINLIKQQIASALSVSKEEISDVKTAVEMKMDSTKAMNSGINISEQYKANEKEINEIYLSTVAKGNRNFSVAQTQNILSIAHQCPYAGGNFVYLARAIYHLINPYEEYTDEDLCNQLGYYRKFHQRTSSINEILVYPNPANETLKLEYFGDEKLEKLEILGLDNRTLKILYLVLNSKSFEVKTGDLAPGLYLYKITFIDGTQQTGKFTIMH